MRWPTPLQPCAHTHISIVLRPQHSRADSPPTHTPPLSGHSDATHWRTWQYCSLCVTGRSALRRALTWGDLLEPEYYRSASPSSCFWQLAPLTYFYQKTPTIINFCFSFHWKRSERIKEKKTFFSFWDLWWFFFLMVQHSVSQMMQE